MKITSEFDLKGQPDGKTFWLGLKNHTISISGHAHFPTKYGPKIIMIDRIFENRIEFNWSNHIVMSDLYKSKI